MHVRVLVRARPLLPSELDGGSKASLLHLDTREGRVGLVNKQGGTSNFAADHVCDSRATQDDIFRLGQLSEMVGAVAEGYNATVFAYGQTYTHTRCLLRCFVAALALGPVLSAWPRIDDSRSFLPIRSPYAR